MSRIVVMYQSAHSIRVAQTIDDGRYLIVHRRLSIVKSWLDFVLACTKTLDFARGKPRRTAKDRTASRPLLTTTAALAAALVEAADRGRPHRCATRSDTQFWAQLRTACSLYGFRKRHADDDRIAYDGYQNTLASSTPAKRANSCWCGLRPSCH